MFILNFSLLFSQNDTISEYDTNYRFDSIANQYKYFEIVKRNEYGFQSELKLIENKIIKTKYAFHQIENGFIKKSDSLEIKRNDCNFDVVFYDEINRVYKKVGCKDSRIKFIEKKEKDFKSIYTFQLGSLKVLETYKNNEEGYLYEKNERGNIKTYQIFLDKETRTEINRKLLSSTYYNSVVEIDGILTIIDFDWKIDFEKEKKLCECNN